MDDCSAFRGPGRLEDPADIEVPVERKDKAIDPLGHLLKMAHENPLTPEPQRLLLSCDLLLDNPGA